MQTLKQAHHHVGSNHKMESFIIIADVEKTIGFIMVTVQEYKFIYFVLWIYVFDSSDSRVDWLDDYRPINKEGCTNKRPWR